MKSKKLSAILLSLLMVVSVASLLEVALAAYIIPADRTKAQLVDYSTFVDFSTDKECSTLYCTSSDLYIDDYSISVEGANLTIGELFEEETVVLTLSQSVAGQSIIRLNTTDSTHYDKLPTSIQANPSDTQYSVDRTSGELVLTTNHVGEVVYSISYYEGVPSPAPNDSEDTDTQDDVENWDILPPEPKGIELPDIQMTTKLGLAIFLIVAGIVFVVIVKIR